MKKINSYFVEHDLFNKDKLLHQCQRDGVYARQCSYLSHIWILHYKDEVQFKKLWTYFNTRCRGLIVDLQNKKLLAIPYFKFFTLGQKEIPPYEELVKLGAFEVSEKLDGSMANLFYDNVTNNIYVSTKGSADSEHSLWATQWARDNFPASLKDPKLLRDYTLMFELVSNKFRIVVDYEKRGYKEGLYLIGVRHNISQNLFSYKEVQDFAKQHNLMTLKTYEFDTLDSLIDNVKQLPFSEEGYVIRFISNGLMVKIKGNEYLRVHRFISQLDDKHLLECMANGTDKDLINLAPEEYIAEVEQTIEKYRLKALDVQTVCYGWFADAPKESRKDFAFYIKEHVLSKYHRFLWDLLDSRVFDLKKIYQWFLQTKQYGDNLDDLHIKFVPNKEFPITLTVTKAEPYTPRIDTSDW
jgi:RNA ligase